MKPDTVEAMMLIIAWDDMETFCRLRDGLGCKECPYDLLKACDRKSTTWTLHKAAEVFRKELKGE